MLVNNAGYGYLAAIEEGEDDAIRAQFETVEGLSESLAIEVAPLGIKVTVVEPGPFRTDWAGRSIVESKTVIADYAETAGKRRSETRERSGTQAGDPERGAETVIAAVVSARPLAREFRRLERSKRRRGFSDRCDDLAITNVREMKVSTAHSRARCNVFPRANLRPHVVLGIV